MSDIITLTGVVGTPPRNITTAEGLIITSFRLASSQRRFDRQEQKWVDGDTNWYTVSAFRQLAVNTMRSIEKGNHVVVTGRLRVREWRSGERAGINVDVEADSMGHDLSWGTSTFSRTISAVAQGASGPGPDATGEDPADPEAMGSMPVGGQGEVDPATGQVADAEGGDVWSAPLSDAQTPF
jgi:single-strand DNA-binding protein